jgi:hypothetical protein
VYPALFILSVSCCIQPDDPENRDWDLTARESLLATSPACSENAFPDLLIIFQLWILCIYKGIHQSA